MSNKILTDAASLQQLLATLLVRINKTVNHKTAELVHSLKNLAGDVSQGEILEDTANLYLKRMEEEIVPGLRSSEDEIVESLSTIEQIMYSICISEMPQSHGMETVGVLMELSTMFGKKQVDLERLPCNESLKNALRHLLAIRTHLELKHVHLLNIKLTAERSTTFATLVIPKILSDGEHDYLSHLSLQGYKAQEAKKQSCYCCERKRPLPRYQYEGKLNDTLRTLEKRCLEFMELKSTVDL